MVDVVLQVFNGRIELVGSGSALFEAALGQASAAVLAVLDQAFVSAAIAEGVAGVRAAIPINGNPNDLIVRDVATPDVDGKLSVLITRTNTGPAYLTAGAVKLLIANGGGGAIPAGGLPLGKIADLVRSGGGAFVLLGLRSISALESINLLQDRVDALGAITERLVGAPLAYPKGGNVNEIEIPGMPDPAVGSTVSALLTSTNTGQAFLTVGGVRLFVANGGGQAIPAGGLPEGKIADFNRSGGGAFVLERLRDIDVGGSQASPLANMTGYILDNPYGDVANQGGVISFTQRRYLCLFGGSSIGVAQGSENPARDRPGAILVRELNAATPTSGIEAAEYGASVPGSGTLDMEAQFANAPNTGLPELIRGYVGGMNDVYFFLWVMTHTFPLMRAAMLRMLKADKAAGRLSVVWTCPPPRPDIVNLGDARFNGKIAEGVPVSWPFNKVGATAGDVRAAIGSDTVMNDWTGGGIQTRGVRAIGVYNAMIRDVCRRVSTAICVDAAWSFTRYGIEAGVPLADLYFEEPHFSGLGYQTAFLRPTRAAARAIMNGDLGTRYFRGDE